MAKGVVVCCHRVCCCSPTAIAGCSGCFSEICSHYYSCKSTESASEWLIVCVVIASFMHAFNEPVNQRLSLILKANLLRRHYHLSCFHSTQTLVLFQPYLSPSCLFTCVYEVSLQALWLVRHGNSWCICFPVASLSSEASNLCLSCSGKYCGFGGVDTFRVEGTMPWEAEIVWAKTPIGQD